MKKPDNQCQYPTVDRKVVTSSSSGQISRRPHHLNQPLRHDYNTWKSHYRRDLSRLVAERTKTRSKAHVCHYFFTFFPIQICWRTIIPSVPFILFRKKHKMLTSQNWWELAQKCVIRLLCDEYFILNTSFIKQNSVTLTYLSLLFQGKTFQILIHQMVKTHIDLYPSFCHQWETLRKSCSVIPTNSFKVNNANSHWAVPVPVSPLGSSRSRQPCHCIAPTE